MKEIEENIKERGYTEEVLNFEQIEYDRQNTIYTTEEYDFDKLNAYIQNARAGATIPYYRDISNNVIVKFVKRIIRKISCFLIVPIVEEQNIFNLNVINSLNQLEQYIKIKDEEMKKKDSRIKTLEKQISELSNK